MGHLFELRDRLLRVVLAVVLMLLPLLYFANDIYTIVAGPLLENLPEGSNMIAIEVASPFLTPFKLSMVSAIFLSMPFILYQFWAFMAPGLYQHERRMVVPLIVSSTLLFYAGILFAYFVVFPLIFAFLTGIAPEGVAVMTDISKYLDFVLKLVFAFGIAFEVPIATIILVWTGMTTPDKLADKRPYIIVGAFVIGMLLTPPDIISQTLLALPMWVLFEIGIFFARRFVKPKTDDDDTEENTIHEDATPAVATTAATAAATTAASEAENSDSDIIATADEWDGEEEEEDEFVDMTDEEMEAELDRIEEEDEDDEEPEQEESSEEPQEDNNDQASDESSDETDKDNKDKT